MHYAAAMGWYLKYGAIAFIIVSTILWGAENIYFMKHASARATKACAGQTSFFDGPNSYYWCLRRVEAGGQP
ncbi:hypothetical protein V1281_001379 [Nitrobacteraceae bacterium AZCC 2161]